MRTSSISPAAVKNPKEPHCESVTANATTATLWGSSCSMALLLHLPSETLLPALSSRECTRYARIVSLGSGQPRVLRECCVELAQCSVSVRLGPFDAEFDEFSR